MRARTRIPSGNPLKFHLKAFSFRILIPFLQYSTLSPPHCWIRQSVYLYVRIYWYSSFEYYCFFWRLSLSLVPVSLSVEEQCLHFRLSTRVPHPTSCFACTAVLLSTLYENSVFSKFKFRYFPTMILPYTLTRALMHTHTCTRNKCMYIASTHSAFVSE